jgi:hypothetical protein
MKMDKLYLKGVLDRLVAEREVHDQKYADNAVHNDCLPRMDKAIENIRKELGEEPGSNRLDFSVSESALPDAIQDAVVLQHLADEMDTQNEHETASLLKRRSQEVVFKELNELDGFDR